MQIQRLSPSRMLPQKQYTLHVSQTPRRSPLYACLAPPLLLPFFATVGTTRALAGSAANFVRIDREYVLAAAKAAMTDKADENQRVIYCSSSGSNSKSSFLYMQSKGLTEEGLAGLGYSDCILFKPAYLAGANRERTRYAEKVFGVSIVCDYAVKTRSLSHLPFSLSLSHPIFRL